MKKTLLAIVAVAFISFSLAACGTPETSSSAVESTDTSSTVQETEESEAPEESSASSAVQSAEESEVPSESSASESGEVQSSGEVGDYTVAIQGCTFGEDYEGKKMIVVKYDFTNNSAEGAVPLTALNAKAFQDGVELDRAISIDPDVYDAGIAQKEVKPGATLAGCQAAFVLDSESPVQFEVSLLISFNDAQSLTKEFPVS